MHFDFITLSHNNVYCQIYNMALPNAMNYFTIKIFINQKLINGG